MTAQIIPFPARAKPRIDWEKLGLWILALGINALCWWGIISFIRWLL